MSDIKTPAIELPVEMQLRIRQAAEHLKRQFAGVLNAETIERFMYDSLDQLMENARIPTWLPLLAERFAKDRLRALVRLQAGAEVTTPAVLFLCVHNAGRSRWRPAGCATCRVSRSTSTREGRSRRMRSTAAPSQPWPKLGLTSRPSCRSRGRMKSSGLRT